jgi:hypothetical protein
MTSGPLTTNTLATYTYDARNRLLSAGGLSYGYDSAGNRTSLTNGTNTVGFVVNPNAARPQGIIADGTTVPVQGFNFSAAGAALLFERKRRAVNSR